VSYKLSIRTIAAALCAGAALAAATAASAGGLPLVGTWSWNSPGQGGMDHNTIGFGANGSYVRVSQLTNGELLRYSGTYRAAQVSGNQVQVLTHTTAWLPTRMCAQAPGFAARCQAVRPPPESPLVMQFASANMMRAQGMTLVRDRSPYLLQQRVQASVTMGVRAPTQPNIRQPVMPYQPGLAISATNHANARAFIDGRMRGCTTLPSGQLVGCQQ